MCLLTYQFVIINIIGYNTNMPKESKKITPVSDQRLESDLVFYRDERSYSFFPDPEESEIFATGSLEDIASTYASQPDMAARFTHELWRIGRYAEIRELAKSKAIPDITTRSEDLGSFRIAILFMQDLVKSNSMMIHWGGVNPRECAQFVCETMILTKMGLQGINKPEQLGEQERQELKEGSAVIGKAIQETIQTVKVNEFFSEVINKALTSD
jgi:hypothetical protein